jgi:hypothetical protein
MRVSDGNLREKKSRRFTSSTLTHHPAIIHIKGIPLFTSTMMRSALLLALAIVGGADAFKFMSNFQPAKILTNDQKVELAKTKERFGDKSKFS